MVTSERVITIGQIVHFRYLDTCRAAIVTNIDPNAVSLCVLNTSGLSFTSDVEHDDSHGMEDDDWPHGFTWHWLGECGKTPEQTA